MFAIKLFVLFLLFFCFLLFVLAFKSSSSPCLVDYVDFNVISNWNFDYGHFLLVVHRRERLVIFVKLDNSHSLKDFHVVVCRMVFLRTFVMALFVWLVKDPPTFCNLGHVIVS